MVLSLAPTTHSLCEKKKRKRKELLLLINHRRRPHRRRFSTSASTTPTPLPTTLTTFFLQPCFPFNNNLHHRCYKPLIFTNSKTKPPLSANFIQLQRRSSNTQTSSQSNPSVRDTLRRQPFHRAVSSPSLSIHHVSHKYTTLR